MILAYMGVSEYVADTSSYMGSIVGRYGNRIALGRFTLEGQAYQVPPNNGRNALHGGAAGFFSKVWSAHIVTDGVELTLVSPDGDMGFPGTLTAHVLYQLAGTPLKITYTMTTTKTTVVSLTNHAYFNLAGESSGTILSQRMKINADAFTPFNKELIPAGALEKVAGTPLDFRTSMAIGTRLHADSEQLANAGGYDHNFVLNKKGGVPSVAAEAVDPASGRTLTVTTTQPGVQFYSGNFLDGTFVGIGGVAYGKHAGSCLETQHFPDSPNQPGFPSVVLKPGITLRSSTTYTFGTEH